MMFRKEDFRQLRWPLAAAGMLMIAGAASLWYAENYLEAARQKQAAIHKQRLAAQDRVAKASEEEREIRNHLVYFQRMTDAGMVGSKNRLDLIEKIAAIKTQLKLFDIKYSIEPQKPVDYPGITPTGAMEFVTSRMQLDMTLLHEEDLLNFLRELRSAGQSLVSVRTCTLNRLDRGGASGALAPGVQAKCSIDLINLV
jgi:hypothetical protein